MMNNPLKDINMWRKEPPPVVPKPLPFSEWFYHNVDKTISNNDYAPRGMAGRYLAHGFNLIASNLPEDLAANWIVEEAVDIWSDSGKFSLRLKSVGDKKPI